MTLLYEAHEADLTVTVDAAGKLVITGPKAAWRLAKRLLERKAEVIEALAEIRVIRAGVARPARLPIGNPPSTEAGDHLENLSIDKLPTEAGDWHRTTRPAGGTSWLLRGYEHLTADLDVGHEDPPEDAICRCGSTTWHDVAIHDGQSTRRDCDRCGRFLSFASWYGAITQQKKGSL